MEDYSSIVGLSLTVKSLSKESRLRLLGSRHLPSGGPWLSWRLGAFLSCSSSMIAWKGSKKTQKKHTKATKPVAFFCKKCEGVLGSCVGCIGGVFMVQVRLYSAGFGQGSFVGLQCWFPPLGIGCGLVFAYRRFLYAK